jgi:hypothetical protein
MRPPPGPLRSGNFRLLLACDVISMAGSSVAIALAPVGTAVAGPVAGAFGTSAVLAVGGILIVLLTVAVLCVPEVRHLRRQLPAHPAETAGAA